MFCIHYLTNYTYNRRKKIHATSNFKPEWRHNIYFTIIRSILEYCCEVWHNAIIRYLSDELEKIQKCPGKSKRRYSWQTSRR